MIPIRFKDVSGESCSKTVKVKDLPNGTMVNFDCGSFNATRPTYMVMATNEWVKANNNQVILIDLDSWEFDSCDPDYEVKHVWDNKGIKIDMAKWNWGNVK